MWVAVAMAVFLFGLVVICVGLISIVKPIKNFRIQNRSIGANVFFLGIAIIFAAAIILPEDDPPPTEATQTEPATPGTQPEPTAATAAPAPPSIVTIPPFPAKPIERSNPAPAAPVVPPKPPEPIAQIEPVAPIARRKPAAPIAPPAAAQEKPDAAAFKKLWPDALAQIQIGLQMADPQTSGKVFYLGAVSISAGFLGQACDLRVSLRNTLTLGTIDNLTLVLTSHGEYGEKIGVHEVKFRFVDPNYSGSASVTLDRPCPELSYIRPREVTTCRFNGIRITDCLAELPERLDVEWINAPK